MKTQHLNLEDGILEINNGKIIIADKSKLRYFSQNFLFLCSLLYAIGSSIRGYHEKDWQFFIFGVMLSSFWIVVFIKEIYKRIKATQIFDAQVELKEVIALVSKNPGLVK
jgi:hypothetical protein